MQRIASGNRPLKLNLFEIQFQPNRQTMKFQFRIIDKILYGAHRTTFGDFQNGN